MQTFIVTLEITVNTAETVSCKEVNDYVKDYMEATDEHGLPLFDIGAVDVVSCTN